MVIKDRKERSVTQGLKEQQAIKVELVTKAKKVR